MKYRILIAFLFVTATSYAGDRAATEPADLAKARDQYEADVKAATNPIKAEYLYRLDEMVKAFETAGDNKSAEAVKEEIKSVSEIKPAVTIVGNWAWHLGDVVEFRAGGTGTVTGRITGKYDCVWQCVDKKTGKFSATWCNPPRFFDAMQLSADGSTLVCKNKGGDSWIGRRLQ